MERKNRSRSWIRGKYRWSFPYKRKIHKETELHFFKFIALLTTQTCLLQSTPLHSWYTAPNVFSSSGTRRGTCFARWREGPVSNIFLSFLPSEIGELLWGFQLREYEKVRRGQIWRAGRLEDKSRLMLRQKFTDKEWCVSRCIVMVQHPGVVCPRLRPLPRTAALKCFRSFR